jgi:hypothetical protein
MTPGIQVTMNDILKVLIDKRDSMQGQIAVWEAEMEILAKYQKQMLGRKTL